MGILVLSLTACEEANVNDADTTETTEGSFSMTYDGVTYTDAIPSSLVVKQGMMNIFTSGGYSLIINGIGEDGDVNTVDPTNIETLYAVSLMSIDMTDVTNMTGFTATTGTIARNGNTITVNVTGRASDFTTKQLSATITAKEFLD